MPNLTWTYTTLFDALQKWPVNSSAVYLAQLPTIIGLGERRLWRDLNLEEYDKRSTSIAMTTGVREVDKPVDVIQLRTVGLVVETPDPDTEGTFEDFVFLELRSFEFCRMYAPRDSVQGQPKYFAELSSGLIYVVPTPDQDYAMQYRYVGAPPESLSVSAPNADSWLSRAVPDALFSACLMAAEQYLKADDRFADMQNNYQTLVSVARLELRQSTRSGDYTPVKAAAVTA